MSNLDSIKSALHISEITTNPQGVDFATLEKACSVWQKAAEAEKCEVEAENARRIARSENTRFWISAMAPSVGALALVLTLGFQINQFNQTTRETRAAEEDKQWRETLKTLSNPETLAGIGGIIELRSFFNSPRYRDSARDYSLQLLGSRGGVMLLDTFEMLFPPVMETTDWSNYSGMVLMLGRMKESYYGLDDLIAEVEKRETEEDAGRSHVEPTIPSPGPPPDIAQYPEDSGHLKRQWDMLTSEIALVGNSLAKFLRTERPHDLALDLAEAPLWKIDLSDMDLSGADLTNTWFWSCNVEGASLEGISDFGDSIWQETAWWRAKGISRSLLDYLKAEFPFSDTNDYPGTVTATAGEYKDQLARLEKSAQ